ncbi:peptidase, M23/M37 family protein [Salinisphaera sp. S4-8]|uniref:M23 family metallopeptidase n=1 Tax=Salinisphaera sp. S4-8 TaxID=633357 RepID=UPI0033400AE5
MRWSNFLRAGTHGALGMSLFVCMGTSVHANPFSHGAEAGLHATAFDSGTALGTHESRPQLADELGPDERQALLAKSAPEITPWREITVAPGDSLSRIFERAGLPARELMALVGLGDIVDPLKRLRPGNTLELRKTTDGRLAELRFKLNAVDTLSIARSGLDSDGGPGALEAEIVHLKTQTRRMTARGTVDGSLAQSLAEAGVPAGVATQLAHIYRYRANLSRHMHPGDRFSVVYDAEYAQGERVALGPVIAASITTGGQNLKAFRAIDEDGDARYYDAEGHAYEPSLSRHPVNYSRISSPFNPDRMHPILHIRRPHWGVDMAAPRGTPIHAAGDGVVKFVGRRHGYGRIVQLTHFDGYSTRYGHMYKFAKGLKRGDHVSKGQIIGYVGATGEATGPHLHYEIRLNGRPHNPLTMKLPDGHPLPKSRLAAYTNRIQPLVAALDNVPDMPHTLIASSTGVDARHGCTQASTVNATFALAPENSRRRHSLAELFCVVSTDTNA